MSKSCCVFDMESQRNCPYMSACYISHIFTESSNGGTSVTVIWYAVYIIHIQVLSAQFGPCRSSLIHLGGFQFTDFNEQV